MLGLQINLSVLSPPPTTATQFFPEKGNVSCGGAEVVSLISPTFPLSSAVIEPPGTTDSSKSDTVSKQQQVDTNNYAHIYKQITHTFAIRIIFII